MHSHSVLMDRAASGVSKQYYTCKLTTVQWIKLKSRFGRKAADARSTAKQFVIFVLLPALVHGWVLLPALVHG